MKTKVLWMAGVAFFCVCGMALAGPGPGLVVLGKALYTDLNLSINGNQSCQSCHDPSAAFADPDNRIAPAFFPVSEGSPAGLFGGRNAPSAAFTGFSPILHFDGQLFIGGMFWDGRASGTPLSEMGSLGDPLAEQAKGPFLNPVEMALGSKAQVVETVMASDYAPLFTRVFGRNAFADIETAYDNIATAIAAFERSDRLEASSSKFDQFVKEQTAHNRQFDPATFGVAIDPGSGFRSYVGPPEGFSSRLLTYEQAEGLALFNADSEVQLGMGGKAGEMCYLCHVADKHRVPANDPNHANVKPGIYPPLFTDFSYDNLGLPVNPRIARLAGAQQIDYGLGSASRVAELQSLNPGLVLAGGLAVDEIGKFKVATLRRNPERLTLFPLTGKSPWQGGSAIGPIPRTRSDSLPIPSVC